MRWRFISAIPIAPMSVPATLANLTDMLGKVNRPGLSQVLFVTVDPDRDTDAVLAALRRGLFTANRRIARHAPTSLPTWPGAIASPTR